MILREYEFRIIQQPGDAVEDVSILATEYAQARQKLSDRYQPYSIIDKIEDQIKKG